MKLSSEKISMSYRRQIHEVPPCTGLVKVVFATGTLAAGINMPARSTVINSVSRRVPGGSVTLKHNELMQMAGRAGRRGFDTEGRALTPCFLLSPSCSVSWTLMSAIVV